MEFLRKLFNNKTKEQLAELSKKLEHVSSANTKLEKDLSSLKDGMWSFKREVNSNLDGLEGKFGWRKVMKKISDWKSEQEFVELYAHVYVLDDGYRKLLPPFVSADSKGNREVLHKEYKETWNGEYKLRCYMVTRLVLPGYYKLDDFLTNNPSNFTMNKMFGKSYQELVSHMSEHNYHRLTGDMYTLNFYEL